MPFLAIRRIAAFLVDYAIIALYVALLTFINFSFVENGISPPADFHSKLQGHLIGFLTLTFPVWLYFTLQESSVKRATLGKRVLHLAVHRRGGGHPKFSAIAIRNIFKFLPWEFAHAGIWYVSGRPFLDAMPVINLVICIGAIIAALIYVLMMFVGSGRTPYDLISRTLVERHPPS